MPGRIKAKYQANSLDVCKIILGKSDYDSPDNPQPTAIPLPFYIQNRPGEKNQTLRPRGVRLRRELRPADAATGAPAQYEYRIVTICLLSQYNTFAEGDTFEYEGEPWSIHSLIPEG
jgi:hypothetical protein